MSKGNAAKSFKFDLVTPDRIVVSENSSMVVIPGNLGDFGVLTDHSPMISSLRPGVVTVHIAAGGVRKVFISGGFADVNNNICSVLAEEAFNVEDLDVSKLESERETLEADLDIAGADLLKIEAINKRLDVIQAKLDALG